MLNCFYFTPAIFDLLVMKETETPTTSFPAGLETGSVASTSRPQHSEDLGSCGQPGHTAVEDGK
jgi:hypothetical protein